MTSPLKQLSQSFAGGQDLSLRFESAIVYASQSLHAVARYATQQALLSNYKSQFAIQLICALSLKVVI